MVPPRIRPSRGRRAVMDGMAARVTGRNVLVTGGDYRVSADPEDVLCTLLGSCVAACFYDPGARIGGMNHFLLPSGSTGDRARFGAYAMELLVNGLLTRGARREGLRAKLFGGAEILGTKAGSANARFALDFVEREGIRLEGSSLGGTSARRVEFWPATGRARQRLVPRAAVPVVEAPVVPVTAGTVELF